MTTARPPSAALREALRRGAPVYLPVNPVEFHGPHLTLLNDHHVSVGIARDLHARLRHALDDPPFLLAQDLGVGVDPCPGPGSRHTPYRAVRGAVLDACARLAELGAQRVVIVTFHGSPMHTHAIEAGVQALWRRGVRAFAPLDLALRRLAAGDRDAVADAFLPVADEPDRAAMLADVASDFHAGFIETSLALHYAPDHVDEEVRRALPPCPAIPARAPFTTAAGWARALGLDGLGVELELLARGLGWMSQRPFLGYTGRPDLANPESGRALARVLGEGFAEAAERALVRGERPPPPMLGWLPALTLGGRLPGPRVPLDAVSGGAPAHASVPLAARSE